ncbi:ribosomal-protein-alanine acetyltransferase [Agaricicola taiwanensis]|uniref:Ribosomal-protein-alanine acetyltransferase n=1 Tax=Agaricicola taiwanensis TaxID=591372 RepID=A0A8J2YF99_9RHOB|nr:GNAT family N-acetyltransferase [Agaricicola taiwanensis]GGE29026.1 ribosomal-protein-alanine acetyltransferase [Agaricicola taiwanensis]
MSDALFGWRTPDWRTREGHPADSELFSALHGQCFARAWSEEEFESLLSEPGVVAHIACDRPGAPMVGLALSRIAADEAEILSIAILPARRGRGGGHALLAAHLNALAGRGVARVFLEVDEENTSANILYARFGFREVGRREAYYARADGTKGAARVLSAALR